MYTYICIIIIQDWSNLKMPSHQQNISTIKKIFEYIQEDPPKIHKNTKEEIEIFDSFVFLQSNCYRLIEILYDRSSLATIKGTYIVYLINMYNYI
jgi:hypothetical protein